jgi:hypothetical protein
LKRKYFILENKGSKISALRKVHEKHPWYLK